MAKPQENQWKTIGNHKIQRSGEGRRLKSTENIANTWENQRKSIGNHKRTEDRARADD